MLRHPKVVGTILTIWVGIPLVTIGLLLYVNLRKPWEFDESYNLQVVQNLRAGRGFSTNGAFRGVGPYEFDPYISTGPSVLLPIWIAAEVVRSTLLAARIVMFAYFSLLLVVLRALISKGREGWFQFGVLLILIAPVVAATNPLFVLGEVPAIALIASAVWAAKLQKYVFSGVLSGMALLCKLNFAIAVGVLIIFISVQILLNLTSTWKILTRSLAKLAVGCAAPVFLFEGYRLISLGGLGAYRQNISELRGFIATQRLKDWTLAPGLLGDKVRQLADVIPVSVWIMLAIAVVSIMMTSSTITSESVTESIAGNARTLIATSVVILCTFLLLSNVPWVRQGSSAFYVLLPFPVLLSLERMLIFFRSDSKRVRSVGLIVFCASTLLLLTSASSQLGDALSRSNSDDIGSGAGAQSEVARIIRDSGATGIVLDGWFQNPELQLLSGVPAQSMPETSDRPIIVVSYTKFVFGGSGSLEEESARCGSILYQSETWLVCWPLSN